MKKCLTVYIFIIVLCIVFGVTITYFFNRNQVYQYVNSRGSLELILTPEQVARANKILEKINFNEYSQKRISYRDEYYKLKEYEELIIKENLDKKMYSDTDDYVRKGNYRFTKEEIRDLSDRFSGYTPEQIDSMITDYYTVNLVLSYTEEFNKYVDYVIENAENLSKIKIFSEEKRTEIAGKGHEYSILKEAVVKAYLFAGIEKLFENHFADIAAFFMVILCAWFAAINIKNGKKWYEEEKGVNVFFKFLIIIGLLFLFFIEACAVNVTYEISYTGSPLQSIPKYKYCSFEISIGLVLAIRTSLKFLFYYSVFVVTENVIILARYRFALIITGIAALTDFILLKETRFDLLNILYFEKSLTGSFSEMIVFLIICGLVMAGLIVLMNIIFRNYLARERKKDEELYLTEINEKYNEIRTIKHDLNNHLSAVLLLMNEGKNEEARKYLRDVTGIIDKASDIKKTGIRALDLLLWSKASKAKLKNINIKMTIEGEYSGISISEYEMCSVFANILDNAIEVNGKLMENDRYIYMRVAKQMDLLCIFCENPYLSIEKKDGEIVTSKNDKNNHGLGIKQIKRIAEKHGGMVEIDDTDRIFRISVIMNT